MISCARRRLFRPGGARPPTQVMVEFIDEHRGTHGVESICKYLPIAPSTYYHAVACRERPEKRSRREKSDEHLCEKIHSVWDQNYRVYGYRKVWEQLLREGCYVARCTVARLMKQLGIQGIRRCKQHSTTVSKPGDQCPRDLVNRAFDAECPCV